jgi:hypothetical protein
MEFSRNETLYFPAKRRIGKNAKTGLLIPNREALQSVSISL